MKHAVIKAKTSGKTVPSAQINSTEKARKISKSEAIKSVKIAEKKDAKKSGVSILEIKKPSAKIAKSVQTFAKQKSKTAKVAPAVPSEKSEKKKIAPTVAPQKPKPKLKKSAPVVIEKSKAVKPKPVGQKIKSSNASAPREKEPVSATFEKHKPRMGKTASIISVVEPKSEKRKIKAVIAAPEKPKSESSDKKAVPVKTVKKAKPQPKKAEALPRIESKTKISKIKSAVVISKSLTVEKSARLLTDNNTKKSESEEIKQTASRQKADSAELKIKATAAPQKLKPKKVKSIGAAVFRGRKERYDFQVYPLDAELIDVPAIYVISKRKTDKQKRAHHALVCIGQTDSVSGEIKKHKNKCIKKHDANVISILPEENEKKRLKIEEDLKAAHAIACGVG